MLVYALSIAAALCFGVGAIAQQHAAAHARPADLLRLRLLLWLVRRPVWLLGVLASLVGNLLVAAALERGTVVLVQPLLSSRLLFALVLAALWARRPMARRDLLGAAATAVGLATFIGIGAPHEGPAAVPSALDWALGGGCAVALSAVLVGLGRGMRATRQAPLLAAGAGVLFGLQSGLTKTAMHAYNAGGVPHLLTSWLPYAVAVVAVIGAVLVQSAYGLAPLPASYPAAAVVEPLAGIGIGVAVLGGSLATDPTALAAEAAALAVMAVGISLLAGSQLVTGQRDLMEGRLEEAFAGRHEDELERLLDRVEARLARFAGRPLPPGEADAVTRELGRATDLSGTLAGLLGEIDRHRRTEQARAATRRPEEQARLEDYDRELAQRQQELQTVSDRLAARLERAAAATRVRA